MFTSKKRGFCLLKLSVLYVNIISTTLLIGNLLLLITLLIVCYTYLVYLRIHIYTFCIQTYIQTESTSSTIIYNGIPRCSVLGPVLFLLYINHLPHSLSGLEICLFAFHLYFMVQTTKFVIWWHLKITLIDTKWYNC